MYGKSGKADTSIRFGATTTLSVPGKVAASAGGKPLPVVVKEYEFFDYPDVTDEDTLTEIAQRVWEERSRQELTGQLKTSKMWVERYNEFAQPGEEQPAGFDVLTLQSGDRVRVELEQEALNAIQRIPTEGGRIKYLTSRGYNEDLATLMAKNVVGLSKFSPEFQVRTVRTTHEVSGDAGTYETEITFINRIDVSGNAQPAERA